MEGRNSHENGEVTQEVEGEIQTGGRWVDTTSTHKGGAKMFHDQ